MLPFWLKDIFTWWFTLFIGGVFFLPLTRKIFKNAPDGAYPFAKILALALTSYPVWLLGSLKILPFAAAPIWLLLLPPLAVAFVLSSFKNNKSRGITTSNNESPPAATSYNKFQLLRIIIFEEFLFLAAFSFWLFVRSHEPSLQSLEKPMDFGIINSLLRADSFPPKDMWLAGFNLNYYYYGHFVVALLIKITGVLPEIGYNLMLATLFALTFTAAFSFGLNLVQSDPPRKNPSRSAGRVGESAGIPIIIGLLTAFFLTLFGNLHPLYTLLKGAGSYWYPDATRFIERTIHEFPSYSFVVADLHGHLLDIPFVLLTVLLLKELFLKLKIKPEGLPQPFGLTRGLAAKQILLGLLLAILYITNSVDALIYGALFLLLLLFSSKPLKVAPFQGATFSIYKIWRSALVTFLTALAFATPFLLTFKPFIEALSLAPERSPLWQLLILWGGFLPLALGFLFYFSRHFLKTLRVSVNPKGLPSNDAFVASLILFSLLLILFPEFFYFKDIYTTQPRANTLFKFSYQAFILLSLVTPYLFFRIINFWEKQRLRKLLWSLIFTAIMVVTSAYPFFAIRGFYGELGTPKTLTLNGLEYLRKTSPGDYQAVLWLKNNVRGQPVILEAVGESYTNSARISANTGLPTIFGWPVHEWLWRKGNHFAAAREPEVVTIYQTEEISRARELLQKYGVKYVMVGPLERERYPNLNEEKFGRLGVPVFASGESRLYKIRY